MLHKNPHAIRLAVLFAPIVIWPSGLSFGQRPAAKAAGEANGTRVELIDPGQEPRRALRLKPPVGAKESVVVTAIVSQAIELQGVKFSSPTLPGQKATIDFSVKKGIDEGDIAVDYAYSKVELVEVGREPSPKTAAIEEALKPLERMAGSAVMSDRGLTKKLEFAAPAGISPRSRAIFDGMKLAFQQIVSPLPDEPVGVGAKWKVVQPISTSGIRLNHVTTQELVEHHAEIVRLKSTVAQEAAPQEVQAPGPLPLTKTHLKSLTTTGTGSLELDLRKLVPRAAKLELTSDVKASVAMRDDQRDATMKIQVKIDLAPANNAAGS